MDFGRWIHGFYISLLLDKAASRRGSELGVIRFCVSKQGLRDLCDAPGPVRCDGLGNVTEAGQTRAVQSSLSVTIGPLGFMG